MAINKFSGGLVLVSHDFRLIGQVAKEIWVCDKKTIAPWTGDIKSYKMHLKKEVMKNGDKIPLSARHCITIEAPIFGEELPNDDYEKVQLTPTKGVFAPDPDSDEGTP